MGPDPAGLLRKQRKDKDGKATSVAFYFQRRIPREHLGHFPEATGGIFRQRLADKLKDARRDAVRLWKRVDDDLERIKATGARHASLLQPAEAERIARELVHSKLAADEEARMSGRLAATEGHPLYGLDEILREADDAARARLGRGVITGHLRAVALDWLTGNGYDVDPSSDDFARFTYRLAQGVKEGTDAIRRRNEGEIVPTPPKPADGVPVPVDGIRLSHVIKDFLDRQDQSKPMFGVYERGLRLLVEFVGDKAIGDIKSADVRSYFDTVAALPPRWQDICRREKITARELAARNDGPGLSPKTFTDSYKAAVGPFLRHARLFFGDLGWPHHLTIEGIKYPGRREEGEDKQRPMTGDELKRLFEGSEFAAFAADPAQAHRYWLPLIGLYTGARVNEVCQLNPQTDIVEEDGVWCLHFTDRTEADDRIRKSIKNKASRRLCPIHSELIRLGFLDYAQQVKASGARLLFPPEWFPDFAPKARSASENPGAWFREFLEAIGLRDETPGGRLVGYHAFRFTFETRAYNLKVPSVAALTGHAEEGKSSVERGYLGSMSPRNKRETLEKIRFDLDPPPPAALL